MTTTLVSLDLPESPWSYRDKSIVVGKDILEVLSSAMYVDPMAIYREYIQNAADAIDQAHQTGMMSTGEMGIVEIELDLDKRAVKIRDNGAGIDGTDFETRMTSFGASVKRGTDARGFRGVGRLAGLGYCQELLFRSRSAGESRVSELRWDCRTAKNLLRSADFGGDLDSVVARSVQMRQINGRNWPPHFFEVELRAVPRLRNDQLLNQTVIEEYLSQVAPLPFSSEFSFGREIDVILRDHAGLADVALKIAGNKNVVFRPHRNSFDVTGGVDRFREVQPIHIPGTDGGTAAVGWVLHHGYMGAVPNPTLKGLRLRSGNIQVGGSGILEDLFTETRFNSWCVGEIHVIDSRIIPNGRRDHYEHNIHYTNLINHLAPLAREISSRCRQSSIRRNWLRQIERRQDQVRRDLAVVKQGALSAPERQVMTTQVQQSLDAIDVALAKALLMSDARRLRLVSSKLRRSLVRLRSKTRKTTVLDKLAPVQRRAYERAFALVYECSGDKLHAKLLVDRMLAGLTRALKTKRRQDS